jgi:hypothetical protein
MSRQHYSLEKITEIHTNRLDILIQHAAVTQSVGLHPLKAKAFDHQRPWTPRGPNNT